MNRELGQVVSLYRRGKKYASPPGIVSQETLGYQIEIGGAQKTVTATCMIRVTCLPERPNPGDMLSVPCMDFDSPALRYTIVSVSGGNMDPWITLSLTE